MPSINGKTARGGVLVLGGTGAMGLYLNPLLASMGWDVSVTSRSKRDSSDPRIAFIHGNAKDAAFLEPLLARGWDAVVDFMVWSTDEFKQRMDFFLSACDQYVYLSSYRAYADSPLLSETSPRLLNVCGDETFLETDEYGLAKARQEDLLAQSGRHNFTIVRPAITYSTYRFQLCTMESDFWLRRALSNRPIPVAEPMLAKETTMTWAGDVASMIAFLVGREGALGETFNVSTGEHHPWSEVLEVYREHMPVRAETVSLETYEQIVGGIYQIRYDRMFDRRVDNRKIVTFMGSEWQGVTPLAEGIGRELDVFLKAPRFGPWRARSEGRADLAFGSFATVPLMLRDGASPRTLAHYAYGHLGGGPRR